jgi:uncharacterized protein (UPF0264 family)
MAKLLVSVRNESEALEALAGGADVIDVKDPFAGSLGAPSVEQLQTVRQAIGGRVPLSAACGELPDLVPDASLSCERQAALRGYELVKLGLSGCARIADWRQRWARFIMQLPDTLAVVAVVYADYESAEAPCPADVVDAAGILGCRWLLIDTHCKSRGGLFEHWTGRALAEVTGWARQAGMRVALAGSLTCELVPRALGYEPDLIAVRGAACREGRMGVVTADRVRRLADQIASPAALRRINNGSLG